MNNEKIAQAIFVKAQHEKELMANPNVVGVGIGMRQRGGEFFDDEVVIVVHVRNKKPTDILDPSEILPSNIDGVPVDVQEAGTPQAD